MPGSHQCGLRGRLRGAPFYSEGGGVGWGMKREKAGAECPDVADIKSGVLDLAEERHQSVMSQM